MLLKYVLKVCAHYRAVCVIGTNFFICSAAKVETFFVNANERGDFFQKAAQSEAIQRRTLRVALPVFLDCYARNDARRVSPLM
jgi:hypothetical protein